MCRLSEWFAGGSQDLAVALFGLGKTAGPMQMHRLLETHLVACFRLLMFGT